MVTLQSNFHARPILYDIKQSPTDFATFTTVNTYAAPVYTWITTFMSLKIIKLVASSANDIDVEILGSYDGVTFDQTIRSESVLAASETTYLRIPEFYAAIQVYAKSHENGKAGVLDVKCIATSHVANPNAGSVTFAYEQTEVTSAKVVTLNLDYWETANSVTISVENAPIRARWDGGIPNATSGHLLLTGDSVVLNSNSDIRNFQCIAVDVTAQIDASYSR